MSLSDPEIDALRALINEEQGRVARTIESLTISFADIAETAALDPHDDEHDPEGSTTGFERAQVSALLAQAVADAAALDDALARLEGGTFGRCRPCGVMITMPRLLALPSTTMCFDCASRGRSLVVRT